jgi:hypothetical protein
MVRHVVLVLACVSAGGCGTTLKGSGVVKREGVSNPPPFEKINVGSALKLKLHQGAERSVVIEADENLLPYVMTEFKDGEFFAWVDSDKQRLSPTKAITIHVSTQRISSVKLSGACSGESSEIIGESLVVETDGASSFKAPVHVKELVASSNGASHLTLTGTAEEAKIDLDGASRFEGKNLECGNAVVHASGASNAVVRATGNLTADATGAASIRNAGLGIPIGPIIKEAMNGSRSEKK